MGSADIPPFKKTGQHSYHRRSHHHDYFGPFIYHIILDKENSCERFGEIQGDARIAPGNIGCASINESPLGQIIAKAIIHLPYEFPIVKLHRFCVMPDHVHILLQILFRSERHLDFYIESLTERIAAKYSKLKNRTVADEEIFKDGYCDKPLYQNRSLSGLYIYIQENPHRLAMRKQYPQFFQRVRGLKIGEREVEAYGNLFLLRNPDKAAVKITRKLTDEENTRNREKWLDDSERGTILVSPFISQQEKEIRTEAEALGAKIILIVNEAFPERYKPAAHDFELCSAGRLLIISMGNPPNTPLSRAHCLAMNDFAATLATVPTTQ